MKRKTINAKQVPGRPFGSTAALRVAAVALLLAAAAAAVEAEGLRTIASVTVDTWFDGDWRIKVEDVFLARVAPALTLQAKVARTDASTDGEHSFEHWFHAGPVVSFTDTLYLITAYGVGIDSEGDLTHEAELDLNYETVEVAVSMGARGRTSPDSGYGFVVPSLSARIRPTGRLGLFGKIFASLDTDREVTGSLWSEADYALSPLVRARAGCTLSYANGFGYSVIGGVNFQLTPNLALRYSISYLGETVDYQTQPVTRTGIENALILDWKF